MVSWNAIDWRHVDWITPAIHVYALVVLCLTVTVYVLHRARLTEMGQRLGALCRKIDGRSNQDPVRVEQITGLIIHLGDVVEHRPELNVAPILEFVRQEEQHRYRGFVGTLVDLTETMIELFPMLGILGTVWGISGIGVEEFSSERLLFLFAVATTTTLWALFYVIVFRIGYAALVQGSVSALAEYNLRYQQFLTVLEKRSHSANFGLEPANGPWTPATS